MSLYYLMYSLKMLSGPYGSLEQAYDARKKLSPIVSPLVTVVRQIVNVETLPE